MNHATAGTKSKVVVYEWKSSDEFLIQALIPAATRIAATPGDTAAKVESLLPPGATDFVFHLSLSDSTKFIPDRQKLCRRLRDRGLRVWNGPCLKTTKRFLHRTCKKLGLNTAAASVNGPANELLILKTNYNCGGLAESWLTREDAIRLGRISRTSPFSGPLAYPVLRRSQVAPKYWRMRSVVVEKYIQSPDQRIFRGYVFGNAGVLSEGVNAARIKKMYPGIPRKNHAADLNRDFRGRDPALQNIHDQMRRLAAGLALDYAAIDFVCDKRNRAFTIDINLTPHWGSESQPWLIRHLRRGLYRQ